MGDTSNAILGYGFLLGSYDPYNPSEDDIKDDVEEKFLKFYGKTIESYGLSVEYGGNCHGATDIFVFITASVHEADSFESTEINPQKLIIGSTWAEKLSEFCNILKISNKKPQWILAAYYG